MKKFLIFFLVIAACKTTDQAARKDVSASSTKSIIGASQASQAFLKAYVGDLEISETLREFLTSSKKPSTATIDAYVFELLNAEFKAKQGLVENPLNKVETIKAFHQSLVDINDASLSKYWKPEMNNLGVEMRKIAPLEFTNWIQTAYLDDLDGLFAVYQMMDTYTGGTNAGIMIADFLERGKHSVTDATCISCAEDKIALSYMLDIDPLFHGKLVEKFGSSNYVDFPYFFGYMRNFHLIVNDITVEFGNEAITYHGGKIERHDLAMALNEYWLGPIMASAETRKLCKDNIHECYNFLIAKAGNLVRKVGDLESADLLTFLDALGPDFMSIYEDMVNRNIPGSM